MKKSLLFSFGLIGTIALVTAVPLLVLGFSGRYLDQKINSGHDFFITGLILSIAITYFSIRKVVKIAVKKLNKLNTSNGQRTT